MERTFLEFFAGGGMARAGLGPGWRCLFANDIDPAKCAAYRANWGDADITECDIQRLGVTDLPAARADLAWASFPCQDLSLAGGRGGLAARRSGLFFEFARLIQALGVKGRAPRLLVIENVAGLLTSRGGDDFRAVAETISDLGYAPGALVIDARLFVPQSRPRLFFFGFERGVERAAPPEAPDAFTPLTLLAAVASLRGAAAEHWAWISARPETRRNTTLADIIEIDDRGWSEADARRILSGMAQGQRAALQALLEKDERRFGAAFRRMRAENGGRIARWEARFDGVAGCLRTPAGGSSIQRLIRIENGTVTARQITPREAARLMGLPESYVLPAGKTKALKLCGDGVAVPVARWIAEAVLEPALCSKREKRARAA